MKITDIKIRKTFENKTLKAIVSLTFDNELAVHDVKIIYSKEKLFLIMPSKKNPDGTFKDIIHPINSEFRIKIEKEVLDYYHHCIESLPQLEVTGTDAPGDENI